MRGGNVNYYKVLHVSEDASYEEIKRSYRLLSKRYHPDTPEGNEQIMARLNEAYATLSDPVKRHFYKVPSERPKPETRDEKPVWATQSRRTSKVNFEPEVSEPNNGWAVFFAYVLAIPIAILLVTLLTPVANRFFTKATNNAVVQPGNVEPTKTQLNQQIPTDDESKQDSDNPTARRSPVYYR